MKIWDVTHASIATAVTVCSVLAYGVLSMAVAEPARSDGFPGDRILNAGAETGDLSGWQASDFHAVAYGTSPTVPTANFASANGLGSELFAAGHVGAKLSQTVSLADIASAIDSGGQQLSLYGWFGGAGSDPGGIVMTVQPLNADGQATGSSSQIGLQRAADRGGATTMLACSARMTAPVGTRNALVTVEATGQPNAISTGSADFLYFSDQPIFSSAIGPPPGTTYVMAGLGCERLVADGRPPVTCSPPPGTGPPVTACLLSFAAQAPPPGIAPTTPAPTVSCPMPRHTSTLHLSLLRLTPTRLSLRISRPATVHVVLERQLTQKKLGGHVSRHPVRYTIDFLLHARKAGVIRRALPRLPRGRYRITARVTAPADASGNLSVVRFVSH